MFSSSVYLIKMHTLWQTLCKCTEIPKGKPHFFMHRIAFGIYAEPLLCILYALLLCIYYKQKVYILKLFLFHFPNWYSLLFFDFVITVSSTSTWMSPCRLSGQYSFIFRMTAVSILPIGEVFIKSNFLPKSIL